MTDADQLPFADHQVDDAGSLSGSGVENQAPIVSPTPRPLQAGRTGSARI